MKARARSPKPPLLPILMLVLLGTAWSQDITVDEEALFSDTSSLADSARVSASQRDTAGGEGRTASFSGNILSAGQVALTRDYFGSPEVSESRLATLAIAVLNLDVRMLRGYKAYAAVDLAFSPSAAFVGGGATVDTGASWRLPEIFLDANIARRAYFRAGKQVVQWGRNFFFNPTDLINVERQSFFPRLGSREGVFGAKAHIPFGTAWNLYGFLDTDGIDRPDSLAGAARVERLLGRTEFSLMIWDRGGRAPVYGGDVSTRLWGLDVTGELALHQAIEVYTVTFEAGAPAVERRREEWAPRAAFGLGRSFRVSGVPDRLRLVGEYYYNGAGVADRRLGLEGMLAGLPGDGTAPGRDDALASLAATGFFRPNSFSRHYAAFFATLDRLLRRSLTWNFNVAANLDQSSALLSTGLAYQDLNGFALSFWVNGFAGPDDTEYTLAGEGLQAQVIAEASF